MFSQYIDYTFVAFFFGSLCLIGFVTLILFVQYFTLTKKLDRKYFNEKYYSVYELNTLNSFPLCVLKILVYQRAIVLPGTMKKRFKNSELRQEVGRFDVLLSTASFVALFVFILIFINAIVVYYLTA